jgi:hypothetical protein
MTNNKSSVEENFIAPLLMHFAPPELENPAMIDMFYDDIIEDVMAYPLEVLRLAVKKIRRSRVYPTFPPIAECLAACREAHGELIKPLTRHDSTDYPEWSKGRVAAANQMICCPMGVQAAQQGWIVWLWDWCREHDGLPNKYDAQKIVAKFRAAEAYYVENDIPLALLSARQAILAKREQLSKFVMERGHGGSQHIQSKPLSEAGDFPGDRRTADAPRY